MIAIFVFKTSENPHKPYFNVRGEILNLFLNQRVDSQEYIIQFFHHGIRGLHNKKPFIPI